MYYGFGVFLLVCFIGLSINLLTDWNAFSRGQAQFTLLFLTGLLGCGIGLILSAIRFQLTLTFRAITLHSAFTTRTVLRKNITEYMIGVPPGGSESLLYLFISGRRLPALTVPLIFEDNTELLKWIDGIPRRELPSIWKPLFR